jgi:hypothetical protein
MKQEGATDEAGAAYIFEKTLSGWNNGTKVTAGSNADAGDWFGDSVAVSGDYIVVGAPRDEIDSPPTSDAGAAYVFYNHPATGWDGGYKITAIGGLSGDWFGQSVAISGDWLIVGALGEQSGSGAAFIFERTGTDPANIWNQRHKFKAGIPVVGAAYGISVAISGNYAVVGAPGETVSGQTAAGRAYVYRNNSGTWSVSTTLQASTPVENAKFGYSVAISGDYIIVGAYGDGAGVEEAAYVYHRSDLDQWDDEAQLTASDGQSEIDFALTVGINSEFAVVGARFGGEGAVNSGSAYVFHRLTATTWNQGFKILPSDGQVDDYFGYFIGLCEEYLIVGAHHEDSGGDDTGSAYVFE